jgi:ComF family protein
LFFDVLSIFGTAPPLQLPEKQAGGGFARFFGQDCLLCLADSDRVICPACESALPSIEAACDGCAITLAQAGLCGECLSRPFAFDDARSCFEYRFPLDRLVHRFKFAGDLAVGRWLALRLAQRVADARPDLVVAPPLTGSRLRERGFNQALEIAKVVARRVHARCDIDGLVKARETAPQPGLSRRERRANLRDAFRCRRDVDGLHVAVVDDVMTTGATLDAVSSVLKRAGAARVSAWCVARTVR